MKDGVSTSTAESTLRAKLGPSFDPSDPAHVKKVMDNITATRGTGWEIVGVEDSGSERFLLLKRRSAATTFQQTGQALEVGLRAGTTPNDGPKMAALYAEQHPGYHMIRFDPFVGKAVLAQCSDDELRCRGAVANALGLAKAPWEVLVRSTDDGGFAVVLPKTYVPSAHDAKLQEVAEVVVGQLGWRVDVNTKVLPARARFIPGEPPLFPAVVPYPVKELGTSKSPARRSLIGVTLPLAGEGVGEQIFIDWQAQAWALMGGLPGGGKSVCISGIVAQQVAAGALLAICDDKSKSVDFLDFKKYCMPGGWGCDSKEHTVATLGMVYEMGQERSTWMAEHGYVNWLDIPEKDRFAPIFVIVDEAFLLLAQDPVPKGLPKEHPVVAEINASNFASAMIFRYLRRIVAEQRFVGVRLLLANQVTNQSTGLPPSLKSMMEHRILMGANPSGPARAQAFNDERSVPHIPEHVKSSGDRARGVGLADLAGQAPVVFKSLFSPVKEYAARLAQLGLPICDDPAPSAAQIAKYAMTEEVAVGEDVQRKAFDDWAKEDDGSTLTGFEKANAARHALAAKPGKTKAQKEEASYAAKAGAVSTVQAGKCNSCDSWINPATGECKC